MLLPDPKLPWPIPLAAVELLAEYEQGPRGGCALKAYKCPAGIWTIGWGETDDVHPGDTCTKEQADQWLLEDVTERAIKVKAMCKVEPSQNELGALVVLAYNIGLRRDKPKKGGLYWSTVLRQHNAANRQAASRAFNLFNKARNPHTGQLEVLPGLTARRAREQALYLTPDEGAEFGRMPQAVEPESKLTKSPIAVSGGTVTVAGAAAAVASTDAISSAGGILGSLKSVLAPAREVVNQVADVVGMPPGMLIAIALIVVGIVIVNQRANQRSEGWA